MTGPRTPRWTHIALPSSDLDASIAWYERFTPLRQLARREDADGQSAWLAHEGQTENPFVLVLVMFWKDKGRPQPMLAPFAHIGIEMPDARRRRRHRRARPRGRGCLTWEPTDMPDPIGYICALNDPDGNVIEISHNQGVYDTVQQVWGGAAAATRRPSTASS